MDGEQTITVSRDTLRAELLQQEIRLTDKLVTKADHAQLVSRVDELQADMNRRYSPFERGEFTDAQNLKLDQKIGQAIRAYFDTRWVWKERRLTVYSFIVSAAALVTAATIAYLTFKYHPSPR